MLLLLLVLVLRYKQLMMAGVANRVTGLTAKAIVVSDAIALAQANAHSTDTTGVVTATISDGDLTTLAGLTSTAAEINGNASAYTITVTDATAAADVETLENKTSVQVTVNSAQLQLKPTYV